MGSRGLSHAHKGAGERNLLVWSMCAVGSMYPLLLSMQLTLDGLVGAEFSGMHHVFEMDAFNSHSKCMGVGTLIKTYPCTQMHVPTYFTLTSVEGYTY